MKYADYSTTKTRIIDGQRIDWYYDDVITYSHNDADMNEHTSQTLKGVSLLKLGAEYKPISNLALRVGYNCECSFALNQGVKGVYDNGNLVHSPGTYYTSSGEYTNWKAASLHLRQAAMSTTGISTWRISTVRKRVTSIRLRTMSIVNRRQRTISGRWQVKNNRSQLLLTVGYRF